MMLFQLRIYHLTNPYCYDIGGAHCNPDWSLVRSPAPAWRLGLFWVERPFAVRLCLISLLYRCYIAVISLLYRCSVAVIPLFRRCHRPLFFGQKPCVFKALGFSGLFSRWYQQRSRSRLYPVHRIVGITYSAPPRMPLRQRAAIEPRQSSPVPAARNGWSPVVSAPTA